MHILVIDGDGGITGTPGAVLEKFTNLSKARDAKTAQGSNLYYKDVIKANSAYLFWGAHENVKLFDVNTGLTGDIGSAVLNRKFDLFKNDYAIKSIDDPTGTNLRSIPLVNTKNTATLKYQLRGGGDGIPLRETVSSILTICSLILRPSNWITSSWDLPCPTMMTLLLRHRR